MSTAADMLKPLPGAIEPRWWPGIDVLPPESCVIDGAGYAMDETDLEPDSALARRMNQTYDEVGLVWLRNTGLKDLKIMRRFGKLVSIIVCNYRFAHGRPGIHLESGERRELGVLIGDAYERIGDLAGKW